MGPIWTDLLAPEWWFTTVVAGLMVGVASSFVYDFFGSKKEKNDSLVPQQNLGVAPTETIAKRPSLIADLVSVHALLSLLSIIWFFLNAGIQKGLYQSAECLNYFGDSQIGDEVI